MTSQIKEIKSQIVSMTPEQKASNLSALTYIKGLASQANVNIYDWNVLEIFAQEDGVNLILDKKVINARFFDHLEKIKKQPKQEEINNNLLNIEAVKKAFVESAKRSREAELNNLKNSLYDFENNMRRAQQTLDSAVRNFLDHNKKIVALEQVTDIDAKYLLALKGIQKLIDEHIWVNPVCDGGYLYLNTNTNIMLKETNRQASLDLNIDLGQLAVRINIANGMGFEVIPYRNNLSVDGFYHPHIQSYGGICWGEAQTTAMKAIANMDFEKALRLLHAILYSYNAASPYVPLARFKLDGSKLTRIGENLKHPDKRKKPKEEDVSVPAPNTSNASIVNIQVINTGATTDTITF